jgi:hypothetical protein
VREEGEAALERQRRELREHLQQQATRAGGVQTELVLKLPSSGDITAEALSWDGSDGSDGGFASDDSWEHFHAQHSAARFFKEKRYLALEFPALAVAHPPQHVVEVGCGCGSGGMGGGGGAWGACDPHARSRPAPCFLVWTVHGPPASQSRRYET